MLCSQASYRCVLHTIWYFTKIQKNVSGTAGISSKPSFRRMSETVLHRTSPCASQVFQRTAAGPPRVLSAPLGRTRCRHSNHVHGTAAERVVLQCVHAQDGKSRSIHARDCFSHSQTGSFHHEVLRTGDPGCSVSQVRSARWPTKTHPSTCYA